ncbi:hypothetical protein [Paenibacillus spongiae]|uniref:Uncharacterized protein n=1 Tax=Paenibacillus spongiae TaxID=2909671 RepID=A0ABY5SA90_9BACL|nr:hypothetical protein [Paenibacillus spongiae]UVI29445.1 hypothetical protein L1F29_29170 [Paenibacillus spongiae]
MFREVALVGVNAVVGVRVEASVVDKIIDLREKRSRNDGITRPISLHE